jgi:putative cell wall-binding protein
MSLIRSSSLARSLRLLSGGVVAVTLVGGGSIISATSASAVTPVPSNVHRIAGSTRLATAIGASQDQFPTTGSASAVVLARSDTFPDALAGGPLAAKLHGPLLLTSSASLDAPVQAEIVRVAAPGSTIYILGGPAAISSSVDTALTGLGFVPKRVFGSDRFATAVAVADAMGDPTTVFEATGANFPDALAGGPAAIKTGGVILLTNGDTQSTATAAYLAAHTGGTHYALGGPAATADPSATPLVGDDRFWTSEAVAFTFFESATTVGAATGLNFPDALAAGADLASKGAPLLLVPTAGALPTAIAVDLFGRSSAGSSNVLLFGGTASVSDDVATQLGVLAGASGSAAAASAAPANTGEFGVSSEQLLVDGLVGKQTVVIAGTTGALTAYKQGGATVTDTGQTRAAFAALPLTNPDALKAAVNTMFASLDTASGLTGTVDDLFTVNAEQVILNPIASPSLRLAVYAALAADDEDTDVTPGVKDSTGRVGIEIFASTGATASDKSKISYIVDPNTWTPLEDTVLDSAGAVVERQTILSVTTSATMPADPYTA